ncbi:TTK kinase, partial [Amia calva]|nr:TTK kinase [Amia calva]
MYFPLDNTDNMKQILSSSSPESCLAYLMNAEKRGNPNTDSSLLKKLMDRYTLAFSYLPVEKHSQNESYARMLVRFAELRAIQDPDEAHDDFNMARINSKSFAFVHIAHAQFELSQGNIKKSTSILQKAFELNARPTELLEVAMQNLKSGKAQLQSPNDKENMIVPSVYGVQESNKSSLEFPKLSHNRDSTGDLQLSSSFCSQGFYCKFNLRQTSATKANQKFAPSFSKTRKNGGDGDSYNLFNLKVSSKTFYYCFVLAYLLYLQKSFLYKKFISLKGTPSQVLTCSDNVREKAESNQFKMSSHLEQCKSVYKEPSSEWKIPARITRPISPEVSSIVCLKEQVQPQAQNPIFGSSRRNFFETPNYKMSGKNTNSVVTPVLNKDPPAMAQISTPYNYGSFPHPGQVQQPFTPFSQTPQGPASAFSNESITIKGRTYFILKQIGRGGSSKVFQVLDHKKQLFAVKYVNLEEADSQTIESYRNEIEHLNHLQQNSDQIIKLYDYEMTNSYIYMLMECGNLDLNTWLRSRKSVNPLERKFYWRNMLEAVQTIHQHGIIHSDLKPANFVIVNASLKLIDFGIANHIQPDVTSIVKDSQVGTLNYMPPESIKDPSSFGGKPRSKISPKSDVWSLGCILYCMTYGKTPFQHITNQITKLQAIIDPSCDIEFPDISEKDLQDVLRRCLVRNPKERISIAELLEHPYLQLQQQRQPEPAQFNNQDLKRIFSELAALNSPRSISRAANVSIALKLT